MNILQPGMPARAKLDQIQAEIAKCQAEVKAVERAPMALVDIKQHCLDEVKRYCSEAPTTLDTTVADKSHLGLRVTIASVGVLQAQIRNLGIEDDREILRLGWETVAEVLIATRVRLIRESGREHGLPRGERLQRIHALEAQIRKLSIDEECEVVSLEEEGHVVIRRPDIDGKIVLDVWHQVFGRGEAAA